VTYLLDANVFIQAKNLHYGFDFCPAFWRWLEQAHDDGRVFSIERVEDEIAGGADDLAEWVAHRPAGFFLSPDAAVVPSLHAVSEWANGGGYEPAALATFLQIADFYLIAHAHAHGHIVVTHEVASHSTKRIKIPDACIALGVRHMTPYEMLRVERARFVLAP